VADIEIALGMEEIRRVMLVDDHETIVLRHIEGFAQRAIDAVAQRFPVGRRFAFPKVNANERHS
jgi:hypothetical protein